MVCPSDCASLCPCGLLPVANSTRSYCSTPRSEVPDFESSVYRKSRIAVRVITRDLSLVLTPERSADLIKHSTTVAESSLSGNIRPSLSVLSRTPLWEYHVTVSSRLEAGERTQQLFAATGIRFDKNLRIETGVSNIAPSPARDSHFVKWGIGGLEQSDLCTLRLFCGSYSREIAGRPPPTTAILRVVCLLTSAPDPSIGRDHIGSFFFSGDWVTGHCPLPTFFGPWNTRYEYLP